MQLWASGHTAHLDVLASTGALRAQGQHTLVRFFVQIILDKEPVRVRRAADITHFSNPDGAWRIQACTTTNFGAHHRGQSSVHCRVVNSQDSIKREIDIH